MNVIGVGVDLVEVNRIETAIRRFGDRFLKKIYTDMEIKYCNTGKVACQHFAGKFAAKEAVYKTLNIDCVVKWTEIEVKNLEQGRPYVVLHGKVKKIAKEKNISSILVSISHIKTRAVASAVALSV
ncbi:MAG: holo-ACP synthase [bacterium]|nr:holo-ACP synthase [bacterium]MDO9464004.1 holo-ACP synthase [bacterium]